MTVSGNDEKETKGEDLQESATEKKEPAAKIFRKANPYGDWEQILEEEEIDP